MLLKAKDPISWLTHFIGLILAIISTPLILGKAIYHNIGLTFTISIIIFMLNMMILYAASSIYHYFNISEKINLIFAHYHSQFNIMHCLCQRQHNIANAINL